jgi:hypothetical protein
VLFALQWLLYLSLYSVGQSFFSFQWDVLLLEMGFATILYAPWSLRASDSKVEQHIDGGAP